MALRPRPHRDASLHRQRLGTTPARQASSASHPREAWPYVDPSSPRPLVLLERPEPTTRWLGSGDAPGNPCAEGASRACLWHHDRGVTTNDACVADRHQRRHLDRSRARLVEAVNRAARRDCIDCAWSRTSAAPVASRSRWHRPTRGGARSRGRSANSARASRPPLRHLGLRRGGPDLARPRSFDPAVAAVAIDAPSLAARHRERQSSVEWTMFRRSAFSSPCSAASSSASPRAPRSSSSCALTPWNTASMLSRRAS